MNRKPMYENEACRSVGFRASCNACERIIWEDENDLEAYVADGRGYCKECRTETDNQMKRPISPLAKQLKEYFQNRYSYIECPDDETLTLFCWQNYEKGMTLERLADLLQDYCLASGNYDVQE